MSLQDSGVWGDLSVGGGIGKVWLCRVRCVPLFPGRVCGVDIFIGLS